MRETGKRRWQFKAEWASIVRNRKKAVAVGAVAFIPLLYSFMFLWAFWDPYDRLSKLPVAVVNLDKGAEYGGKRLEVGKELEEKLREGKQFDWRFVSPEEARAGLADRKYYMSIEIPENFSEHAASAASDTPVKAQLKFTANESYNFLSAQIGEKAIDQLKAEVSSQLTKAYAEAMLGDVSKLSEGMQEASDGSAKLHDGAAKAAEGVTKVGDSVGRMNDGAAALQKGWMQVAEGASSLGKGIGILSDGASSLASGLDALKQGQAALQQGANSAEQGAGQLSAGLKQSEGAAKQLAEGAAGVAAGLEKLAANPALSSDPAVQQLLVAATQVAAGAAELEGGQKQLAEAADKLAAGQKQLAGGLAEFGAKLGEAGTASHQLAEGANQLKAGSRDLQNGIAAFGKGYAELAGGIGQLAAGLDPLREGAAQLDSGSAELANKLAEAAAKLSGVDAGADSRTSMIASPVEIVHESFTEVPNYGTGFAPYFISLGLFVGALLLSIVFPLRDPAARPSSAFRWFAGKYGVLAVVGLAQSLLVAAAMLWGLGLDVRDTGMFMLFSLVVSLTYMAIIQLLVTVLGDAGRFVAIILLVLQLTGSAGTFPNELVPEALQALHAWLPMSYSVAGFKSIISVGGEMSFVGRQLLVLLGVLLTCNALTWIYFAVTRKRSRQHTDGIDGGMTAAAPGV